MQLFALHFGHFTKVMPLARRAEKQQKHESHGAAIAEKKSHLPEHTSFYLAARARAKAQASSSCYRLRETISSLRSARLIEIESNRGRITMRRGGSNNQKQRLE
jgi:hypothetical protein